MNGNDTFYSVQTSGRGFASIDSPGRLRQTRQRDGLPFASEGEATDHGRNVPASGRDDRVAQILRSRYPRGGERSAPRIARTMGKYEKIGAYG